MESTAVIRDVEFQQEARTAARVRSITKDFPGTRALSAVDLEVRAGEIHGLIGGNGSGKSTLIKVISGIHQAAPGGMIEVGGRSCPADGVTPDFARTAGVRVVHQDLGVFTEMTVEENLALGNGYTLRRIKNIDWSRVRTRAQRLIDRFEIDARPQDQLSRLSQSTRALVAIARACEGIRNGTGRGLLILDEPTASLPGHEVDLLLSKLRTYAQAGEAILYVSHRLDEILSITDRVTALRDGHVVGTYHTASMRQHDLIELIVGTSVEELPAPAATIERDRQPLLEVEGLRGGPLRDISFSVAAGEIVGIAGLLGAGRSTILRSLFGLGAFSGTVRIQGRELRLRNARDAMHAGIAYVPENRTDAGFFDLPIVDNLLAARVSSFRSGMRLKHASMRREANAVAKRFGVKASSTDAPLATLSGGNQQKVILARWLSRNPKLLLLDEPDQGVDFGARSDIWKIVRDAAASGMAVVVVTSDLEELSRVVDRVLVIDDGRIGARAEQPHLNAKTLTHLVYFDRGGKTYGEDANSHEQNR